MDFLKKRTNPGLCDLVHTKGGDIQKTLNKKTYKRR